MVKTIERVDNTFKLKMICIQYILKGEGEMRTPVVGGNGSVYIQEEIHLNETPTASSR